MEELVKKIQEHNCVTFEIQDEFFKGKDYIYIRDWLENHGFDRHMIIDKRSVGIIDSSRNPIGIYLLFSEDTFGTAI